MAMMKLWTQIGSITATIMFIWAIFQHYFPYQFRSSIIRFFDKFLSSLYPYITVTFPEYTGELIGRSEAFIAIQNYLRSRTSIRPNRLRAEAVQDAKSLLLTMDDNQEVVDKFHGVTIWWASCKTTPTNHTISIRPTFDEKRFYSLTFHRRNRDIILGSFINHIMEQGKAVEVRNRQRKLYMNNPDKEWWHRSNWIHVPFEHPANFRTLAMDSKKKQEIINDLVKFKNGKEYYEKVGKAWKRGYLLYGPPGTGKSTMIASMANFMEYDVYDLELTCVKDNTELKKLLIEISNKSIIVVEDIDCSLDLTGQRKKKKKTEEEEEETGEKMKEPVKKDVEDKKQSKVTLSGLLNVIDGIWSACGGERLIVFTTNHKEELEEALIRRGRMDRHIEMSYCGFEAFRVLATNYLDVAWDDSYDKIKEMLEETEMTPADVAENLMPKYEGEKTEECFKRLIGALESVKEERVNRMIEAIASGEEELEKAKAKG
ncbi:hypothetical protein IC582_008866 [Cucumis melo]|uniref:AAA-ATPase ASD, mitochondrial-like n=1 Tax=Cucumis melo TaxID=3656 RepID=A0A1S3B838_CUCME|nr:AAA-ATPase ASD, mitochondrial-like [Cucumis melo]